MVEKIPPSDLWARMRLGIIGSLLAAPPPRGQLQAALRKLAQQTWQDPVTGEPISFSFSTIERWFYAVRHAQDPMGVLRRQRRTDAGCQHSLGTLLIEAFRQQYKLHPNWSVQLHYDNLAAQVSEQPGLGPLPSYSSVRRYMKRQGWRRRRKPKRATPGARQAESHLAQCEVRSFEAEYTHALWHLDFHEGSRHVMTEAGQWRKPQLLGVLDDHSRVACHLQWYLSEDAQALTHGTSQGFQKRGLPRVLMTDNGGAMRADEFVQGLMRLSIQQAFTLPYSPYQNAKQEAFWAQVEGRLMAMLEGVETLTLAYLNEATCAWVEMEYHHKLHDELGCTPMQRYLSAKTVGRDCPDSAALRGVFRQQVVRRQRRSDGTLTVEGVRFEVPNRYRHLQPLTVRYARWDLSHIDLVDEHSGAVLAPLRPLNKAANASAERRRLHNPDPQPAPGGGIAPLLKNLMADYAASGRPPAYLPLDDDNE